MSDPHGSGHGGEHPAPRFVAPLLKAFYALCAAALLAELLFHKHAEHAAEGWFGFYPAYGFVAIVLLVLLSKLLRRAVMRKEDYYDA